LRQSHAGASKGFVEYVLSHECYMDGLLHAGTSAEGIVTATEQARRFCLLMPPAVSTVHVTARTGFPPPTYVTSQVRVTSMKGCSGWWWKR